MEQLASNALIRPLSEYVGPAERHVKGPDLPDPDLSEPLLPAPEPE